MDELKKEMANLRNQLQRSEITGNAVELRTIDHLNRLLKADERAFNTAFADLKQFWLSSVDWCSELSKQIEKLIIMQDELTGEKH